MNLKKKKKVEKILIIKLAAIGDIMFASPLVENLKANFVDAKIHWLADSWTKSTLKHIRGIDKLYFYDRPWLSKSKFKAYLKTPLLLNSLRRENYDLAIIPHRSNLAFMFAKRSKVSYKVGFVNEEPNSNLDLSVKYDSSKHEVERNLDLLRGAGLNIVTNEMAFNIDKSLSEIVQKKYLKSLNGCSIVCIGPGGGNNPGLSMLLKRWPKERYLKLVNELDKLGKQVVLLGSKDDEEACSYIEKNASVLNLCSKTTLKETAAVIKNSKLYIGNDSALLYIAAALKISTLGIYGPTDPKLLAPMGDKNNYAVAKIACSFCYNPEAIIHGEYNKCDFNQKCMKSLDVASVFLKAKALLEKNG